MTSQSSFCSCNFTLIWQLVKLQLVSVVECWKCCCERAVDDSAWDIFTSTWYYSRLKDVHFRWGFNEWYFRRPGKLQIETRSFARFYVISWTFWEYCHGHISAFSCTIFRDKYLPRKFIISYRHDPYTSFLYKSSLLVEWFYVTHIAISMHSRSWMFKVVV